MRVLLVEDEPDLGAAIKRTLTQQKYLVDWVLDGNEAWAYLDNKWTPQYTLAIFDWMLPGMSGLELCKMLRSHKSPLPVLMLTAKDRMEDKVAGLDAGADDYLVKPFGMAELLARLRALQRRSPQFQPQELTVGNLTLDYGNNMVVSQNNTGKKQEISLTNKEFQLLEYFMKHPNQIVTTEQIRNQLWEVSAEPISNVVAAQIRLLRRKLANSGCGNMIETLHATGYRLNLTP
ncbi:response regulator transcription factor [Anabaena cylindrica FACHB-243]|uniref:Two component transcriptional regulator, winged helix family n=1 Tax=Anabaena cylindrica (strain ATCC 27899 / PCC 7122) TaxID=272123 RepID=K9ZPG3_ANACC|nr:MULTISPECIES: two-component system response regulator RppA [Anabaena]AFZ61091.1 two component transcriptional regulator, winged helix family [Anabaena cylindrica PCC 7122]MBD2421565.1 response regulator transcription factor [Anabaena cylindrica FACHB-243]MBY5280536.1 response regulator transcription factor [Anabaena sp. CCAP 1446/1C]MBY5308125.1 response regulator transcription factor [Anabaena sp. CCAP 1446/1C]MCM2405536.1 response regulator transcription factor [Anabaena sp. CCAP 1446/1C]